MEQQFRIKMDCVFCDIVRRQAPASIVYEDTHTVAFLNRHQLNPGHILVIPRDHIEDIFDIPAPLLGAVARTVKQVSQMLRDQMGYTNLSIWQSNGAIAGQEIFHLHVHVLPRRREGELGFYQQPPPLPSRKQLEQIAAKLRGKS